jgi:hypothetical protein
MRPTVLVVDDHTLSRAAATAVLRSSDRQASADQRVRGVTRVRCCR